jgi:hypothetical protein
MPDLKGKLVSGYRCRGDDLNLKNSTERRTEKLFKQCTILDVTTGTTSDTRCKKLYRIYKQLFQVLFVVCKFEKVNFILMRSTNLHWFQLITFAFMRIACWSTETGWKKCGSAEEECEGKTWHKSRNTCMYTIRSRTEGLFSENPGRGREGV